MSKENLRSESEQSRTTERERETEPTVCPECGGQIVTDEERAETVCENCGLVVEEDEIDHGPEWRMFDPAEKDEKSRVGAPMTKLMHDKGLSSLISWEDEDAHGNALDPRQREKMQRLRKWDERFRTRDSQDRNLKHALGEIARMGSALGLPEAIRETAAVIYRRALEKDLLPGRSIEGVATAALYGAARQADAPRSLDEMDAVSRIPRRELERTFRYIVRELSLEIEPADPTEYLPRYVSELGVSDEVERQAHDLLEAASGKSVHAGRSPISLAAAAIYAAARLCNETVTQDEVGEVADVSAVTIRNRYPELLDEFDQRVPV